MKKRICLCILSIVLMFTLTSCGNNEISSEMISTGELNSSTQEVITQSEKGQSQPQIIESEKVSQETFSEENLSLETVKQTVKPVKPTQPQKSVTVHITKTGEKYHRAGCRYLSKSDMVITLDEAIAEGLTPCSVCKPPTK